MAADQFQVFKAYHENALNDLRTYALEDQRDADCLNPIIHAKDFAAMVRNAPNLYTYAACSAFIDELYQALLTASVMAQ